MALDPSVDPGSTSADPMLEQEPLEGMPPELTAPQNPYEGADEFELRNQVEACCLAAVETCAKAVEVGVGAENPQFAQAYAQAAAALGQAYAALAGVEAKEQESASKPSDGPSGVDGRVGP